MKKFTMG